MVGRALLKDSFFLRHADEVFFNDPEAVPANPDNEVAYRESILRAYGAFADQHKKGAFPIPTAILLKPIVHSFHNVRRAVKGQPNGANVRLLIDCAVFILLTDARVSRFPSLSFTRSSL